MSLTPPVAAAPLLARPMPCRAEEPSPRPASWAVAEVCASRDVILLQAGNMSRMLAPWLAQYTSHTIRRPEAIELLQLLKEFVGECTYFTQLVQSVAPDEENDFLATHPSYRLPFRPGIPQPTRVSNLVERSSLVAPPPSMPGLGIFNVGFPAGYGGLLPPILFGSLQANDEAVMVDVEDLLLGFTALQGAAMSLQSNSDVVADVVTAAEDLHLSLSEYLLAYET